MRNLFVDQTELLAVELGESLTEQVGKIGFTIYNADNSVKEVRTTAGIIEHAGEPGTYLIQKVFASSAYADDWIGTIVWDLDVANGNYVRKKQILATRRTAVGITVGGTLSGAGKSWIHG